MTSDWQSIVDKRKNEFHEGSNTICITDEEVYCVDGNMQSIEVECVRQLQMAE